ncbi:hypothetical protein [Lysinibacillus sp. 54212]|uniref:hypothetical protein n=1 Tax=Lysinibacillus sp. 54212 TaxID=3119829 RepID=UPI002FCB523C
MNEVNANTQEATQTVSKFLDVALYSYSGGEITSTYIGVLGGCLIAYMLFVFIMRSVGGDDV